MDTLDGLSSPPYQSTSRIGLIVSVLVAVGMVAGVGWILEIAIATKFISAGLLATLTAVSFALVFLKYSRGRLYFDVDVPSAKFLGYGTNGRQQQLQLILERLPVGVMFTDKEGKIVSGNKAGREIWGDTRYVTPEHYGEYKCWDLSSGKKVEADSLALLRAIKYGEERLNENVEIETFNGGVHKIIASSALPLFDEKRRVKGAMLVNRDITAQYYLELSHSLLARIGKIALEELEVESLLIKVSREVVLQFSDWCLAYVEESSNTKLVSAVHRCEIKNQLLQQAAVREPFFESVLSGLKQAMTQDRTQLFEHNTALMQQALIDDELVQTFKANSYIVSPIVSKDKKLGFLVFVRGTCESERRLNHNDVSLAESINQRVAIAMENLQLYLEAKRAIRAREEVLAIVAHDVRNPVSSVLMASQIIERMPVENLDKAQLVRYLKIIQKSARNVNGLINLLLDFGKIQSGKFVVAKKDELLEPMLDEIRDVFLPIADEKNIHFVVEDLSEPLLISCERDRLVQVISNLLGNAFKFTHAGGMVTLRVSTSDDLFSKRCVRFEVTDTGVGIPTENLCRVFDLYWQGQASSIGTGLGLAISKGIVEAHGGTIWAESEVGRGSRFIIDLPLEMNSYFPVEKTGSAEERALLDPSFTRGPIRDYVAVAH